MKKQTHTQKPQKNKDRKKKKPTLMNIPNIVTVVLSEQ